MNNSVSFGTYRGFTITHSTTSDGFSARREGFWETLSADSLSEIKASVDLHYKSRLSAGEQKVLRIDSRGKLQAGKLSSYTPRRDRWSPERVFTFRVKWTSDKGAVAESQAPWLDTDENRVRAAEILDCTRQHQALLERIHALKEQMVCFVPAHDAEPANEPDELDELDEIPAEDE